MPSTKAEYAKAAENWERYTYARDNGHSKYLQKSRLCEDFFQGIQWEEKIRKALQNAGRPVMTINKVFATINTVMGEQLQNRADVTFRPVYMGNSETATALAKVFLQIQNQHNYDFMESQMFDDGIIRSRGFIDVTMDFKRNMRGEVKYKLWNSDNILIDPDAESYDPDDWDEVFKTKWMTQQQIERVYGPKAARKFKNRSESAFPSGYDSIDRLREDFSQNDVGMDHGSRQKDKIRYRAIERQFFERKNVPHFVDMETGDTRPVPPTWDRARIKYVQQQYGWGITSMRTDQIHWIATIDDCVVHDAYSPYRHFTPVPYFPYFRRGRTLGLVEHLVNPQEMFNKVASQELHVLNSTANGGWKIKRDSLQNMDIEDLEVKGSQTGLVLELLDVGDAEKIQPNQVPTGLDRMTHKLEEYLKDVSGISDSQRGFDRADVAAKAIEAKQAAGSVNLAKPFDSLLLTRKLIARNTLDLIQTFYTEERVMQITGTQLGAQTEEVVINQVTPEGDVVNDLTAGEYEVVVSSVPTRESFMESQFQEALQMRELGVQIPDSTLIEASNLSKKAEILEGIQNNPEAARLEQMGQLEVEEKAIEIEERKSKIAKSAQDAELSAARAEKTAVDAVKVAAEVGQEQPGQDIEGERMKMEADIQLAREKAIAEMEEKRRQFDEEMKLKREQMEREDRLKRAEANLRLENERKRIEDQKEIGLEQAKNQKEIAKAKKPTEKKSAKSGN